MLVHKVIGLAAQMRVECVLQWNDVVRVHAIEPVLRTSDARVGRQSDQGPPPRRHVELVRSPIPRPQAAVGSIAQERQPLGALLQRLIRDSLIGHVMPEDRRPVGVGKNVGAENAAAFLRRQPEIRKRARAQVLQRGVEGTRELSLAEAAHRMRQRTSHRLRARTTHETRERIVPYRDAARRVDDGDGVIQ